MVDLLQLQPRRGHPHMGARAARNGLVGAEVSRQLRHALPAALRLLEAATGGRPALDQPGPADAVPGVPDPDGLHRTRRPDTDLLSPCGAQRRALPLLLGWLPGHIPG